MCNAYALCGIVSDRPPVWNMREL